ncbi:MAG: adenine phosphoribosyltransferase [Vampirovibrionia bacterium]
MPEYVKTKVRDIPDFPKPGIIFKDITTVIKDPEAFKRVIDFFTSKLKDKNIDYVVGIESRGFIFAGPIAYNLGCGVIIIRKPGKLPADTEQLTYDLEYGTDTIEIHKDAIEKGKRVVIIDDLLATGGTAAAACKLVEKVGGEVVANCFMIDLTFLNGKDKLPDNAEVISMIEY